MGIALSSGAVFGDEQALPNASAEARISAEAPDAGRRECVVADASYRSLREADAPIFYIDPLSQTQSFAALSVCSYGRRRQRR
jgi:hypothetical protein